MFHPQATGSGSAWAGWKNSAVVISRVFRAARGGLPVVIKLTDSRMVDLRLFDDRLRMLDQLAEINPDAVGPIEIGSSLVNRLGDWLAVGYRFVEGDGPDLGRPDDVARMGVTLAALHDSLARMGSCDVPTVLALRSQPDADFSAMGRRQLLHGDFSSANVLFDREQTRIFDFDDAGYGPVEFEVGNTLYMVLFDATMNADPGLYERFREEFVPAYGAAAGTSPSDAVLDRAITLRCSALRVWLDSPSEAPIGIRMSSPEWRKRLRSFAEAD